MYVRDASGNVMSLYVLEAAVNSGALSQTEISMYGSSRLGVYTVNRNVAQLAAIDYSNYSSSFIRGNKLFELSNHLGNVLVTVSDKKIGVDVAPQDGIIDYYTADVVTANDYAPFGSLLPGRNYNAPNANDYRYGFNGKENDNDVKGEGNQQDYGFRIYDPRLGKFLSVDPITKKYPELTPYQFASNRPIDGVDLDGLEYATFRIFVDQNNNVTKITVTTDYQLKNNGTKGPGIEYYITKGAEMPEGKFVKNIYGIYQGGDNPQLPKVGENYKKVYDDYSLDPIDETDANAKQHDKDYDKHKLAGASGIIDDKSSQANEDYIKRADKTIEKQKKGEKDDVTGKPVTKEAADAAKFGKKWFRRAEQLKKHLNNAAADRDAKHPPPPSNRGRRG
jgi:RHS repeat-associated protein